MGATFPIGILMPSESGIVGKDARFLPFFANGFHVRTIVGHENDQCVFPQFPFFKLGHEDAHVVIDIFDHAVARCGVLIIAFIQEALLIFLRSNQWTVGRIQRDIRKERLVGLILFFDPR